MGFRVWGLGFRVWGLGFGVWGLGFRVQGLQHAHHTQATKRGSAGRARRGRDVALVWADRRNFRIKVQGVGCRV